MVNFSGKYFFPGSEVSYCYITTTENKQYPYVLRVVMKNGKEVGVAYMNEAAREVDRRRLTQSIAVDREECTALRNIESKLSDILWTINKLEKRQLKFGRLFKKMVPLLCKEEEIE